jgi:predicted acylesterase/phospholipase RssA
MKPSPAPRPSFLGPVAPAITRLRSPSRPQNYVAVSGGAAHLKELAGGLYALDEKTTILGCVGTSAGALASAAVAFGIDRREMESVLVDMLQGNKVLDMSVFAWQRYGLCHWNVMKKTVRKVWGEKTRMGEAAIPFAVVVSDLYTRTPRVFSSWDTPLVKLDEVLPASSAIPFLVAAQTIPSANTGNRLYCDGGVADNFALDVFADKAEPTVGLCLQHQADEERIERINSLKDYVLAVASLALWESTDVAGRRDDRVIAIKTTGSGFDFNQKPDQIRQSVEDGRRQVIAALEAASSAASSAKSPRTES